MALDTTPMSGLEPHACPRCGRSVEEATIEDVPGQPLKRAGCPCGEVFEVSADVESGVETLATAPRSPARWKEEASPTTWRARLEPNAGALWLFPLGAVLFGLFTEMRHVHDLTENHALLAAVFTPLLFAVAVITLLRYRRPWTFSIEGNRFRASAWGASYDIALGEILRFEPAKTRSLARYELRVHRAEQATLRVPLFVAADAEAQFVADRANALLATGGRTTSEGYRAEHVRVAVEAQGEAEALELETDDLREPHRRRAR